MQANELVSHYRIRHQLGAGGMGRVYLADDLQLRRPVAVKLLLDEQLSDEEARDELLREARAAASLDHPNICPVHEVGTDGDKSFIVMQYVRGETLEDRLERGRLSKEETLDIVSQVARALAAAHREGVIHRDIKPANIRLTPDGRVKVVDFGLAKQSVVPASEIETITGPVSTLAGTPPYMSPEQFAGRLVDGRTDLFSLGAVYYECLTGKPAFQGATHEEVAGQVQFVEPVPPSQLNPDLGPLDDQACSQLLAKDPDARVQSGDEAERLFRLAQEGQAPVPVVVDDPEPTPGPSPRPTPGSIGWLVAAAVTVTAALGYWQAWPNLGGADRGAEVLAVLPLENVSDDPARDYLGVGFADALISDMSVLPGVSVVSGSAAAELEAERGDPGLVARHLGATLVMDGAVQQIGEQLLVTASLVRSDASVLWARSYQRPQDELFTLQAELAGGVADALELTLSEADREAFSVAPTSSVSAYIDYSGGRLLLQRPDRAGNVEAAIALFESAITDDRRFALAHAGLGEARWAQYRETEEPHWAEEATDSVVEALRLDAGNPQVRLTLARIFQGTGRDQDALDEIDQVLELDPLADEAFEIRARILSSQGEVDRAIAAMDQAIAIRPDYAGHYTSILQRRER